MGTVELSFCTRSGDHVWLLASAEILEIDGRGYLLAQGVDISERKRAEKELALYRDQLEARFEERGEQLRASLEELRRQERLSSVGTLASGIAHQINNPIGGIVAAAQFALGARGGSDRDAIREEALARIVEEAQRCGRIVKNILKFARNEQTAKWRNDLGPIVRGAVESARSYVEQRGGQLHVSLEAQPIPVHASPIDLEQVVVNLVRNAAESRTAGVNVRVCTRIQGDRGLLEVSDDGIGFPERDRERLFDPFRTSRISEGGSGLGLSVVHTIVKDHAGRIDLDDAEPHGATVRVALPLLDRV